VSGCSRWNFADGLPETSNCYCHPGIAGGSPAYASFRPGFRAIRAAGRRNSKTIEAKRIVADVKALAREIAPEAVETLKSVMLDPKVPPAARVGAATAILDRGYGKPAQAVDIHLEGSNQPHRRAPRVLFLFPA
jgi:hypothetical protein